MSPPYADVTGFAVADGGETAFLSSAFERLVQAIGGEPRTRAHDLTLSQATALLRQAERIICEQRVHIDRLQQLSLTDELTGLLNRRGFERELRRTIAAIRRHGETAAVLLADLDRFKEINDTFGHQAGDCVLREVAQRLQTEVRDTDSLARLGGDEFGCILTRCDPCLLGARLDRLRLVVEDRPVLWRSRELCVGISIGLAQLTPDWQTMDDALAAADSVMYAQKARRRAM